MREYSKEELIKITKDYSIFLGRTPKIKEVTYNKELPPINQFLKKFGTWNNLLKECNLKISSVGSYSKEELLGILKELKKRNKRSPKIDDLKNNLNLPAPSTYFNKFGSWNNALKEANLKINVRKDYTKEELLDLLRKKAKELGRSPKGKEINQDKNYPDISIYSEHFGTFNNALKEAGLEVKYQFRKWTKEDLLNKLIKKANQIGKTPTQKNIDKDPLMPAKGNYGKYFGSFTNAVRLAGLDVNYNHSKQELINLLQKLSKQLNRTPTRTDMNKAKGYPSYTPFVEKFGSYTAACLRAGLIPNDGRNNKIWQGWEKHCIDMAKIIHKDIEIKKDNIVDGIPDIHIKDKKLFIDAKTCGYKEFKEQVKKYCKNEHKLEFWCIFKGMENRSKKVKYIYADELAKMMKNLGRNDLSAKCYQFINNIYSDEQTILK